MGRILDSLSFRFKRFQLGLLGQTRGIFRPKIGGKRIELRFPEDEKEVHLHEFHRIFIDDCYGLMAINQPIRTVLDIGANAGLFSLAARHRFRNATIHAYEPNSSALEQLKWNTSNYQVSTFGEAVGACTGTVSLIAGENSLHSVAKRLDHGAIPQIAFGDAIGRLGQRIDLLKLDCEGAEWEILEVDYDWSRVRFLTMEYHLWARPGSNLADIRNLIESRGFNIMSIYPSASNAFGLLRAQRRSSNDRLEKESRGNTL